MSKKPPFVGAFALALFLCASAAPVPDRSAMKLLASFAGDWGLVDPEGTSTDLRATYQVVAGGAGVIETLFRGTPEETVTFYYRDGSSVTATQVSGRGDPVRLVLVEASDPDALRFAVQEESARGQPEEGSLRVVLLTRLDDEHLRVQWFTATGADGLETHSFELRREAPIAELAAEVARLRVGLETLQAELDRRLKREVRVERRGEPTRILRETRTLPTGPGWNVSGVPMRRYLYQQTRPFATTFAAQGDEGMTVAHYGFKAGPGCRLRFSILGGHGYVAVVEETEAPPRRIRSIPEFATKLDAGEFGTTIERIVGGHWKDPRAVEWDLARYEGKALRLYVVDAVSNHYGQVGVSEVAIIEDARR